MSQKAVKGAGSGGGKPAQKGKKGAAGGGGGKTDDEREESLQAVVLADSFETRFSPFTLETPRCLLPLANTPLIEYTLEFLAMSGVADIYMYCGAHQEEVERYIQSSKWDPANSVSSPFQTLEIVKTVATSVGDALRDLDARALITGDFLLVHGDLVSNLPIDGALLRHRERRAKDKNSIMTMILRSAGLGYHRTKSHGITPVFVIDPSKNRCLHYEEMHSLQANKYVNIDPDLLSQHDEIEIRTDLIDCSIDICTPEVLALWGEGFDYEVPRRQFLHGVLKDYELNGQMIHTEIVENHYAARASNLQNYEAVSKDVLGRWTYPLVPDSNLVTDQTYKLERGGLCKENGVVLARTCKLGKRTVLGKDTSIGDGSSVSTSIIGRRCQIGKNVKITNAYIWDDVVVGDGSTIDRAIIANESVIGKNCKIQPGALLSFGVRIADNKEVKDGTRITRAKRKIEGSNSKPAPTTTQTDVVGKGGEGYSFQEDEDSDDDEASVFHSSLVYNTSHLNLSSESISTLSSEVSTASPSQSRSRLSSFTSNLSDEEAGTQTGEGFHKDAVTGLVDALEEGKGFGGAKLEFMGLRLATNASDHQIRRAIAVAFVKRISQLVEIEKLGASKATESVLAVDGAEDFLNESGVGIQKVEADQVDFLVLMQRDLVHRASGAAILAAVVKGLYDREVVDEDAILKWWQDAEALGNDEDADMKKVREKTGPIIEWLREAESEEDSDEDSD